MVCHDFGGQESIDTHEFPDIPKQTYALHWAEHNDGLLRRHERGRRDTPLTFDLATRI